MNIGVNAGSHLLAKGGGFKAVYWHVRALRELRPDEVTLYVRSAIHPLIMPYFQGIPIRWYRPGVESGYEFFLSIDHFGHPQPLAKRTLMHVFFPMYSAPPEGIEIYTNSQYTASHVKARWNRDAQHLYIPIEDDYHTSRKENIILHVSRFAEPNEWSDKAHNQFIQLMRMIRGDLPGWRLVLAGTVEQGQNRYLDGLMEMSAGYPIDFIVDPNEQEMRELYGRASLYWHATGISLPTVSSAQEHLGLSPLEASASGCVPLVYRSGGMPEVVLDHKTGLLFDDMRQLGQITIELTHNWHLWAAFSQYGTMWARAWQDFGAFKRRVQNMLDGQLIEPLPNTLPSLKYQQSDVTAIIPTFNNCAMLERCLESLHSTAPNMLVKVVNNGDVDMEHDLALEKKYPSVAFVYPGKNLGYGGAMKFASDFVQTPLIMALNDDVIANSKSWLEMLLLVLNDQSVGVVGPKLLSADGRLQHAGGLIDWNREDIGYHYLYMQLDCQAASEVRETDFITGAALLCRRELFHFDDELLDGLNYEDLDLCMDAKAKGYRVVYQPASCLRHLEGATKSRSPDTEEKVERNRELFRRKWQK